MNYPQEADVAFQKAVKHEAKGRVALLGPAGSGKTYTGLLLAKHLAPGGRVALVDTEHGSASKYADLFDFDTLELTSFDPDNYVAAIHDAESAGYDVLVIDSLSHAWSGKDGLLEFVDKTARQIAAQRNTRSPNSFEAWGKATPKHNNLIEAMLAAKLHLIVTMRVKMEYVQEKNPQTGRTEIRKMGLQPVQRDGLEYEFDVVGDLDQDNTLVITKTRCTKLTGATFEKPGENVARILREWLAGAPARPLPVTPAATPPAQSTAPVAPVTLPAQPAIAEDAAQSDAARSDKAFEAIGPSQGETLRQQKATEAAREAERKAGTAVVQGQLPGTQRAPGPQQPPAGYRHDYRGLVHPWPCEVTLHYIQDAARYYADHTPDAKANGKWGVCLGLMDRLSDHHPVLFYLFGKSSANDCTEAERLAVVKWVDPWKDKNVDEWLPGKPDNFKAEYTALAECAAVFT